MSQNVAGVDVERQDGDDGYQDRLKRRIFGWSRRPQTNTKSLPLKKISTTYGADSPATALHIQAIELLFGLPSEHASKWPGILIFCHHLESCFEELLDPRFDIIWRILHRDSPSATVDCWHWCFVVIKTFQALHNDASIETAYLRLIENANMSLGEIKAHEKIQVLRAMFAVLCWTSATLKPLLDDEAIAATTDAANPEFVLNSHLVAENSSVKYSSKDLRRPISKMFYFFYDHPKDVEERINQIQVAFESPGPQDSMY